MTKVRIVGGGLMGVLAAFEAHRLGCRDIEIHERREELGGDDIPDRPQGLELRDEPIDFGPRAGPLRSLLEWRNVAFDDGEDQKDLTGPPPPMIAPLQAGGSLADWLRAQPAESAEQLGRYCQWRLSLWLDLVDASAVAPLGLVAASPTRKATVKGGIAAMFGVCQFALRELGVRIHTQDMVSPWSALSARAADEIVVWAADPSPLFKACGLPTPKPIYVGAPTYFFRASGAQPFEARSFAGAGVAAALNLYESRRQLVLAAECVREASQAELRREIGRLAFEAGVEGLELHDELGASLRPRRGYRTVDAALQTRRLRAQLAADHGQAVVTDSWEPYTAVDRFAALRAGLSRALASQRAAVAAA